MSQLSLAQYSSEILARNRQDTLDRVAELAKATRTIKLILDHVEGFAPPSPTEKVRLIRRAHDIARSIGHQTYITYLEENYSRIIEAATI